MNSDNQNLTKPREKSLSKDRNAIIKAIRDRQNTHNDDRRLLLEIAGTGVWSLVVFVSVLLLIILGAIQ